MILKAGFVEAKLVETRDRRDRTRFVHLLTHNKLFCHLWILCIERMFFVFLVCKTLLSKGFYFLGPISLVAMLY